MSLTPEQRQARARLGAHAKWARTEDRTAATEKMRRGFTEKLERQVDPDGSMDPATRAAMVESARKEFYQRMALKSSLARAKRREVA